MSTSIQNLAWLMTKKKEVYTLLKLGYFAKQTHKKYHHILESCDYAHIKVGQIGDIWRKTI